MAPNAARQQKNAPVRFTASVSAQISVVVSAKSTGVSTPAAHTSAAAARLVVENGQLLGMVSMRDVTGVFAAMAAGHVKVEHEFDQLVRERRLARIEQGDLD